MNSIIDGALISVCLLSSTVFAGGGVHIHPVVVKECKASIAGQMFQSLRFVEL